MSGLEENLKRVISLQNGKKASLVTVGKVAEVDEANYTCQVNRDDRPELYDVRLNACEFSGNRFVVIPEEGSECLVIQVENSPAEAFLLSCSKIKKVITLVGNTRYELTAEGHDIRRGNETLKGIINDLVDQVIKVGAYKDVPGLITIKTRLNSLFK